MKNDKILQNKSKKRIDAQLDNLHVNSIFFHYYNDFLTCQSHKPHEMRDRIIVPYSEEVAKKKQKKVHPSAYFSHHLINSRVRSMRFFLNFSREYIIAIAISITSYIELKKKKLNFRILHVAFVCDTRY